MSFGTLGIRFGDGLLTSRTAMMRPKRPMALAKISTMRILTKREALAASERAAPEPT